MALGKRISLTLHALGKQPMWLCDQIPGLGIGTLSALINRDSAKSEFAVQIANAMDARIEYLLDGQEPMFPNPKRISKPIDLEMTPGIVAVKKHKFTLSAGITGFAIDTDQETGKPIFFRQSWLEEKHLDPDKLIAVKVCSQSMEPTLWHGDLVVVNTADTQPVNGECFACNFEGELVIKRLRREHGEWWAYSDNPDKIRYPANQCNGEVIVLGRIVYKQSEKI